MTNPSINEKHLIDTYVGNIKQARLNEGNNPVKTVIEIVGNYLTVFTKLCPTWEVFDKDDPIQAKMVLEVDGLTSLNEEKGIDFLDILQSNQISAYADMNGDVVVEVTTMASSYRLLCVAMRYLM